MLEFGFEIGFEFGVAVESAPETGVVPEIVMAPETVIAAVPVMEVAPANWDLSKYPTCKEENGSTRGIWAETLRLWKAYL